jgi:DNA processing protein
METAPDGANFPGRNRIIAGMSLGSLIIEGSQRSGAMITARHASEYNREVFALPGRADSPVSRGPNTLIRAGVAQLVMSSADILDELGEVGRILSGERKTQAMTVDDSPIRVDLQLTDNERKTLNVLELDPMPIEMIVDGTDLSASEVASALTTLQLKRLVKQLPGSQFVPIRRG